MYIHIYIFIHIYYIYTYIYTHYSSIGKAPMVPKVEGGVQISSSGAGLCYFLLLELRLPYVHKDLYITYIHHFRIEEPKVTKVDGNMRRGWPMESS